ncbi:MAG: hypothetical protein ABS36_06220 [Acidobacteria bacterium SCN 69-37]|nr:MAG: hypothetical protein ABS36_06220 [Acidobacteria bacterium SCN 69-37]
MRGRLLTWVLAGLAVTAACAWSDPVRTEVRNLQRQTCEGGGPYGESAITRSTWQVRASWSCAIAGTWDAYVLALERSLVPYRRREVSSAPGSVVFVKHEPGDYYVLTVTRTSEGTPRADVQFMAGPD